MSDPNPCPTCGAPLPSDATGGACPKCLLQAGFATGGAAPIDRVPTPEELAPKFPGLVIEELLGRGGMGVVYKARHKALDREVALKVLPERVAQDKAFADRFQREARALAKLQHPNIVAVHDFGVTDGLFWLVMEYVDGANIRQAMRAGAIGPKEALAIVPQICDALQYAHEHGVVHRDIKPENVLLDKAGHVKVADFGLAKLMAHDAADATLTGAGQVMGTPHYMAPEQWEKPTTVDHRADIYSLGVVFYEMLTGELPVGRFAAPSGKCDVDARIDEIVMRTLEREREARYQQVSQVKTDVGRATTGAAPTAAFDASPAVVPWTRHWKWSVRVSTVAGTLALLWGIFSSEAIAERLWIGGFGLVVCVVQFVDWRIRRAHPDDADTNRRMAWLIGSAVTSVGTSVVLATTLHTAVMRHAAGTLAVICGAFFLVEMWRLRRPPRTSGSRPSLSAANWVAIALLEIVLLGGLATFVVLVVTPEQRRKDVAFENEEFRKAEAANTARAAQEARARQTSAASGDFDVGKYLRTVEAAARALPGDSFSNMVGPAEEYKRRSSWPAKLESKDEQRLVSDVPLTTEVDLKRGGGFLAVNGVGPTGRLRNEGYAGLVVRGDMAGRIDVKSYALVYVSGDVTGTIDVGSYATVIIDGDLKGAVRVGSYTTFLLRGGLLGKLTIESPACHFWFQSALSRAEAEALENGAGSGHDNYLHLRESDLTAGVHTDVLGWRTTTVGESAWSKIAR